MTGLTKVYTLNVVNIMHAVQQIASLLGDWSCDTVEAGDYGRQFIIYHYNLWTALYGVTLDVTVDPPGAFPGSTHANRDLHEQKIL